jgi:hypothetical protein
MTISSPVKYFHSGQAGAPTLSGSTAGSLTAMLDAVLVNGFGLQSVSSLTVASNVATATVGSHSLIAGGVVLIAGASPASLNGEWRVTETGTTFVKFATSGIADQTATGTITLKVAPLNWTTAFTGTNKRVFRAPNVLGTRFFYRFDDTGTSNICTVRGYESMSDVNTGLRAFPTTGQNGTGILWSKLAGSWFVVGDDQGFYFGNMQSGGSGHNIVYVGDIVSERPGDAFNAANCGPTVDPMPGGFASGGGLESCQAQANGNDYAWLARSYSQVGGSTVAYKVTAPWPSIVAQNTNFAGFASGLPPYPDPNSNGLRFARQYLWTGGFRGYLPGLHIPVALLALAFADRDQLDGQNELAGHKLAFHSTGAYTGTAFVGGAVAVDITGPWR